MQISLVFACFLATLWLVHADDNLEITECLDNLTNCPELVARGVCNNELAEKATDCALTCNLCSHLKLLRHQVRPNSRAARANTSRGRSPARAPARPAQRSRPAALKSRAANPARQPAHARSRAAARRASARSRNSRARRPAQRRPRQNVRANARKPAARRPRPRQAPRMGAGTVDENGSMKPIGPNLIHVPKDARAISELAQSKTKMNKLNTKMTDISQKTSKISKSMKETVDSIDKEDKAAKPAAVSGKIQMFASMLFPVQAKWSAKSVKKWVSKAKEIAAEVEDLVKEFDETKKEMDAVMETMKKQQDNFKDRPNIAKSMEGFNDDFGQSCDNVKQIQVILVPTSTGLTAIIKTVDSAKDDDDMKDLENKFRDAAKAFEQIETKVKAAADKLKQVFDSFGSSVDSISKDKGDFQKPRKSGDGGGPSPDGGKDGSKDGGKDGGKDGSKDGGKDGSKDGSKDDPKEPPKFTFACDGGKFIAAIAAGLESGLECGGATEDKAEQFEMVELDGGKNVALKASNKKFCSHADIGKPLKCNKEKSDGKTEQFEKVKGDGTKLSFKCIGDDNKFLTFDATDGLVCKPPGTGTPTDKEKFTSKQIEKKGDTPAKDEKIKELVLLCKGDGKAVTGAAAALECKETDSEKGEKFKVTDLGGGKVNLQGPDGKFCSAKPVGQPIKCTEAKGDTEAEQFERKDNADKTVSFKCLGDGSKYLTIKAGKIQCETAGAGEPTDAEKFNIKEIATAKSST